MTAAAADLAGRLDAACRAREEARRRPRADVAAALAAAATRWRADPVLMEHLPAAQGSTRPVVEAGIAAAADALEREAMVTLVARELGDQVARGAAPDGPVLVAHVLASNVPALALPAIALGCLAGVAVVVKSGRADRWSAPAFQAALATVDPALAATVVTTYWPGGATELEAVVLARAALTVVTGSDATAHALAARGGGRVVRHGARTSVAVIGGDAADDPAVADGLALDVAMHDQRGCLSPQAVYVGGDVPAFARRLLDALERVSVPLPPPPVADDVESRAAAARDAREAEWQDAIVERGRHATVIRHRTPGFAATSSPRTVRVFPLRDLADLPDLLPPGTIECLGRAGVDPDVDALTARGVSRVCRPGRMQRPSLAWPRGQRAPLRSLLGLTAPPLTQVEP